MKRYNKKAGGTDNDFELMKKRLLADINHVKTQGTVKILFTKSKEAQTQTNLTGVDKQIGLVGKDALLLRKEIIRDTGV